MASNRRWRWQFRCRGSRRESAVAQLFSLGGITRMNRGTIISLSVLAVLMCYLCFVHTHLVMRCVCFLAGAFWIFFAWMFFDRIKLGDQWFRSHTGKAGAPGSVRACILIGLGALGIACAFIFCGVWL
jgi:hypothetical protein